MRRAIWVAVVISCVAAVSVAAPAGKSAPKLRGISEDGKSYLVGVDMVCQVVSADGKGKDALATSCVTVTDKAQLKALGFRKAKKAKEILVDTCCEVRVSAVFAEGKIVLRARNWSGSGSEPITVDSISSSTGKVMKVRGLWGIRDNTVVVVEFDHVDSAGTAGVRFLAINVSEAVADLQVLPPTDW